VSRRAVADTHPDHGGTAGGRIEGLREGGKEWRSSVTSGVDPEPRGTVEVEAEEVDRAETD